MTRRTRAAIAAAVAVVSLATVDAAAAQEGPYSNPTPPSVLPNTETRTPTADPPVLGTEQERGGGLPITGGDVAGMVVLGAGLTGAGLVLRGASRRRAVNA